MLYFLIEESSRELSSRILLATIAAEQGLSSCIVPQWTVWKRFDMLPPGIILFKGSNSFQTKYMVAAQKSGHLVAALEEEALGLSLDLEIERQFDPGIADACHLVLAQGDHLRAVIAKKTPSLAEKIVVTGNPRVDLLRPPFSHNILARSQKIRDAYGDYVLVNSNIGAINPRIEDTYAFFRMCRQVGIINPNRPQDWVDFLGRCDWEWGNLALLTRVIGAYLLRSDYPRLIIRPHPAEDAAKWHEAYRDVNGVSVIQDGDHAPWTAGARLMIHTGCTTGMEAALLGTPVLCLEGGTSAWHRIHTSNFVNRVAADAEEAMAVIDRALAQEEQAPMTERDLRNALKNNVLPWPDDLAANRIIAAIRGLADRTQFGGASVQAVLDFQSHDYEPSEHKIDPSTFTADAVSEVASGFASDLGHDKSPTVRSNRSRMIILSPSK
jgi:surface carbohydrate biosynthesis protein